jgi:hypothetical protein
LSTSGHLGIGIAPQYRLHVETATLGANAWGMYFKSTHGAGATSGMANIGLHHEAFATDGAADQGSVGSLFRHRHTGSTKYGNGWKTGLSGELLLERTPPAAATIDGGHIGVNGGIALWGTNTAGAQVLNEAQAFRGSLGVNATGWTVTNFTAFRAAGIGNGGSGTITNAYGFRCEPLNHGTNRWSFYADSDPAYFGGTVQVAGKITGAATVPGSFADLAAVRTFLAQVFA